MRKMRVAIATNPHMANTLHVAPFLEGNALEPEVPHCLVALYRSDGELECDGNMLPSLVINVSIFAGERNNKRVEKSKSAPAHVMTRHPSIQTIVRLDLGGLTIGRSVRREHHERRIQRIADLSSILTWTRDKHGDIVNTCESLSKEDGELRLCLLSGNDSSNASGQDVEVVLKYSEIVDAIRMGGRFGPLGGVPKDNHPPAPSTTLQATVVPFPSFFHRHALASLSNADIAARAARLLGLGNKTTTTPETTMLGGREGAGVFRPLPYAAIQTRAAAVAPWGRVLARLGRKF
ncbi:hypothetical protein B0T21DRAFT_366643 [Apiosordaria backusii]|uniref:Uncharacterized protein n=1 Tax=Apiosordaria backusii TaxID=314023 RepID=A0AA40BL67_9PEZI|nr:hypothetical protein B0T21DRAFT_366643 [Apiosordaria backusii]